MSLPARAVVRLLLAVIVAGAVAACAEPTVGPAGTVARIAFAPRFSAGALEAAAALREEGILVHSIRIAIRRPGRDEMVLERIIPVEPGHESVTLEARLTLRSASEMLVASLEWLDADSSVLYRGTQRIMVRPGSNNLQEIDTAVIEYVGPGSDAVHLHLAPADTVISASETVTLTATALDGNGSPIAAPLLLWQSSDPSVARVSRAGLVTPTGRPGSVKISARIPAGVAATAQVRLVAGTGGQ